MNKSRALKQGGKSFTCKSCGHDQFTFTKQLYDPGDGRVRDAVVAINCKACGQTHTPTELILRLGGVDSTMWED